MKFKITWPTGATETVEQDSATTVEEFCNIHFGSAWDAAVESGVTVSAEDELQDADPDADGTAEE